MVAHVNRVFCMFEVAGIGGGHASRQNMTICTVLYVMGSFGASGAVMPNDIRIHKLTHYWEALMNVEG